MNFMILKKSKNLFDLFVNKRNILFLGVIKLVLFYSFGEICGQNIKKTNYNLIKQNEKISIDIEVGGGHILYISSCFKVKRWRLGLGTGFMYDSTKIDDKKYGRALFNLSAVISFDLLDINKFWLSLRTKLGCEFIVIKKQSAAAFILFPDLLIGYSNFFSNFSLPIVFGVKGTGTIFQVGIGYRIRI